MNFSCFCFLDDILRLYFLLDVSIFTTIDDEKGVKINSSSILKDFTESEEKVLEIHLTLLTRDNLNTQKTELYTNSEDISEIKLPSLPPTVKKSHSIT